jgi:hypothetical protein
MKQNFKFLSIKLNAEIWLLLPLHVSEISLSNLYLEIVYYNVFCIFIFSRQDLRSHLEIDQGRLLPDPYIVLTVNASFYSMTQLITSEVRTPSLNNLRMIYGP